MKKRSVQCNALTGQLYGEACVHYLQVMRLMNDGFQMLTKSSEAISITLHVVIRTWQNSGCSQSSPLCGTLMEQC